jgi:hypothetical protein
VNDLKRNASLVESLGSALRSGDHGLKTVPALLRRVLTEDSWRRFVTQRGELVEYDRFIDFVTTAPLKGIGASADLVRRVVADDKAVVDLLDRALQNPVGSNVPLDNIQEHAPTGTSEAAALRRLRKDAPALHAEVIGGHISAHAAMIQAGFRHRTISVRVDDPEAAARSLAANMRPDHLATLILHLADAGPAELGR